MQPINLVILCNTAAVIATVLGIVSLWPTAGGWSLMLVLVLFFMPEYKSTRGSKT